MGNMKSSGYPKGSPHDKPKPKPTPKPKPSGYPKGSPHEALVGPLHKKMSEHAHSVKIVPNKAKTTKDKIKEELQAKESVKKKAAPKKKAK